LFYLHVGSSPCSTNEVL